MDIKKSQLITLGGSGVKIYLGSELVYPISNGIPSGAVRKSEWIADEILYYPLNYEKNVLYFVGEEENHE